MPDVWLTGFMGEMLIGTVKETARELVRVDSVLGSAGLVSVELVVCFVDLTGRQSSMTM